jgi:hypothetical protein
MRAPGTLPLSIVMLRPAKFTRKWCEPLSRAGMGIGRRATEEEGSEWKDQVNGPNGRNEWTGMFGRRRDDIYIYNSSR